MGDMDLTSAANAMDAMGSPVRLKVYRTLVRAGCEGLSIAELQSRLGGIPRSTLAHHLHKLVLAGLVDQEKEGASVLSRINFDVMDDLLSFLGSECCADQTDSPASLQKTHSHESKAAMAGR